MPLAAMVSLAATCVKAGYSSPSCVAKAETVAPLQIAAAVMLAAPAGG
jgi:hypothetical protein